jgi:hypothetical protein
MRVLGLFAASAVVLLTGCSVTVPVAVVGQHGEVLTGTATTAMTGGSFEASNGKVSCSGSFDPSGGSRTVSLATTCSDGRAGVGQAYRDTATSGSGKIKMNDGTEASFVFGSAATALH